MKLVYDSPGEGIGRITLTAPPTNAFTRPDFEDRAVLGRFLAREDLKGVIVRGAGHHFSSGADPASLASMIGRPAELGAALEAGKALLDEISFATVPVAASIRGSCLGAGMEVALACHFRIASMNAILGLPESGLGLIPGLGGTLLAQEAAGRRVAIEMILSGRMIGAREALGAGLLDAVEETAVLEEASMAFLRSLVADRPPHLIRGIMESIHNARRMSRTDALSRETRIFLDVARRGSEVAAGGGPSRG